MGNPALTQIYDVKFRIFCIVTVCHCQFVVFRPNEIFTFYFQGSYSFITQVGLLFPFGTFILKNNLNIWIFLLWCVIYAVEKLESFLKQCPTFPKAFLIGPADILVIELADQVNLYFHDYILYILMILSIITTLMKGLCNNWYIHIWENFLASFKN